MSSARRREHSRAIAPAPIAQGIEQRPPEPCAQVRILLGAPADEHIRLRWNPTSPLRRAGAAVVSHWEKRGIDPGRGHLHGRDIRDQDTPYFANFGWSHFTSIPYCLTEHGGIEWLEVIHPTKTGPLDCLRFVPLDTAKIELLDW